MLTLLMLMWLCKGQELYLHKNVSQDLVPVGIIFQIWEPFHAILTQSEYYFILQAFPLKTGRLLVCLKIHLILDLKIVVSCSARHITGTFITWPLLKRPFLHIIPNGIYVSSKIKETFGLECVSNNNSNYI